MNIRLEVNHKRLELEVDTSESLLDVLRNRLGLTGAKLGCGEGHCGSCTVLLDGRPVNSCIIMAAEADGKSVTTIEYIEQSDRWRALQQKMIDNSAAQCGFCAPGMVMNLVGVLSEEPLISADELKRNMVGNLCRCGSHYKVLQAAKQFQHAQKKLESES